MRVLQLIGSTGWYGAEAVVSTLAANLSSMGIDTCVGHLRYARKDVFRLEDRVTGCDVFPVLQSGRLDMKVVSQIRAAIRRRGIDAIHSHGYKPDFYGALSARLEGIPILSTCHLWTRATWALRAYASLDAVILRGFRKVVGVSERIVDELKASGVAEQKLVYIPNGIAVAQFMSSVPLYRHLFPRNSFIFGLACRQVKAKGVDLLLRAIPRISALVPNARFLIAGDGPRLQEYRELASLLGLSDKVIFVGRCEAMPEFFASLDTFLLPSLEEGLPIALLEAMASACAVIATNVGSVSSVVRNQDTGILIAPGDIEALSSAMLSAASNRERVSQFGAAARRHVISHFSSQHMVARYADLYHQVAEA